MVQRTVKKAYALNCILHQFEICMGIEIIFQYKIIFLHTCRKGSVQVHDYLGVCIQNECLLSE